MIYFIRHGESEANLRHVFAGQKDNSALTDKGREQARLEGEKIKSLNLSISKIISSPLIRAHDTAKIVAGIIGYEKDILIDQRITEYDMGSLTGTPTYDISSRMLVAAENAEDPKAFYLRVRSFLDEWNSYDGDVLMVCHAGVGRIIETIKLGMDPVLFYDLPPYPNASVIKLDWIN
jgi:broad specificity phosphatase PhoE